jgi:aspartyl-tRNA(Asn)/glutamyl-tRNA(Gln) amidotransferase subunit A
MRDWANVSLTEVADAIATGTVSARDVAEACLERAARLDGTLHCYVELDREATIAAAEAADAAIRRGIPLGPLHGVPLAHKDMYYRAGRISACGSRLREDVVQSRTATVLERLDRAGAIETGRLAMVEFALGPHGYNANYPQCRNAWNPDYIPAGSSSGSGVAVSSGMVFASLGSDTGGSIRCPASVSGVVGLMPTYGRVSRTGVMPMSFSLDVVGCLARRVRDCARLLSVIGGYDPADPTSLEVPPADYEAPLDAPGPLPRIGLARGYFDAGLHAEVAAAIAEAGDTFRRLHFPVEEIAVPAEDLSEICELHPLVMKAEGAANHMGMLQARQGHYTFEVRSRLQAGFFIPAVDYIQALKIRGTYLRAFTRAVFERVDILLTPVLRQLVPTIAETVNRRGVAYLDMVMSLTRNTKVVNYLGLPAVSMPCGFTGNGLPTSFQLIGRPLFEGGLLAAAHRYEQATGWHLAVPPLVRGLAAA